MRRVRTALPVALAAGALALAPGLPSATAATGSVRLFSPQPELTMTIHNPGPDQWVDFNPSIYLKAVGARFEIDVRRTSFSDPLHAVATVGGTPRTIPESMLDGWQGIQHAFVLTWRKAGGGRISQTKVDWCPNEGQASPLSPSAASRTVFAWGCGFNPFTRSQRWGVDSGWARQVLSYGIETPDTSKLGNHPTLDVAMRKDLATILRIPASDQVLHLKITVERVTDPVDPPTPEPTPGTAAHSAGSPDTIAPASSESRRAVPRVSTTAPPADALPDLIPLPSFGMSTHHEDTGDYLDFAATVYNGGKGPLVAEGYRRGSEPVMDAYQRFYRGSTLVGTEKVGTMEYDSRPSHQHWHFEDFATYDLWNAKGYRVRTSGKEAFCLAPTDAIDLLLPHAAVNPGNGDLATACGDLSSIWVREVLAAGWGDTYTQERAGQSMDITTLPNGTYYLRITANPAGRLHEVSTSNNISVRKVLISGKAGARTVSVPPVGVIDSEKIYFDQGEAP
ncbi:lysyl oxidase family protein [Nocardioides marmorisolisilvae]|uniref:Lysyl oxidase n=1 Tax=Nocardioides marmorisolisilvae TaxID=1542737 RepID=A0A3N0E092_9ACTN|nr:lysyl oxidase family protein [Nocardioides marmorisolisilvae]RNL81220.1 hypothetical protein EFL95_02295 [Nocardioides marmorisolisilvae]